MWYWCLDCDYWWNDHRYPDFQRWVVGGPNNGRLSGTDITGCFCLTRGFAGPDDAVWDIGA